MQPKRADAPWRRGGLWSISTLNTGSHCLQSCSEATCDHAYPHFWRVTPALFTHSKWEHLHLKTWQTPHMVQWLHQVHWHQSGSTKVRLRAARTTTDNITLTCSHFGMAPSTLYLHVILHGCNTDGKKKKEPSASNISKQLWATTLPM